ncbi:MAG: class B sortase, partial [Oscillospiraceae bacterium]|nr:class B sortase [Oscillospiraceae bacterium]
MTAKSNKSSKDIALDKFDVDVTATSKKKESKIPKQKNPLKRFAAAVLPQSTDTKSEIFRKAILLVAIATLIGTLAFLIWQINGINSGGKLEQELAASANAPLESLPPYTQPAYVANPSAEIRTTAGTEEPEYIDLTPVVNTPLDVNFNYLKSINPDTRGWVKITGTLINNVVLQRPNDDDFYIDHDFYGNESVSGEVFSSWRNKWDGTDDNIVLFGHNMKSGYFFAYVNHYVPNDISREPLAFYKVHPTIMLQRDGGPSETYKVFAGIVVNTDPQYGEVFNYTTKTKFNSADEFNQYILDVMDRSWFYTDVDLQYGDKLLTLSTCYWPLGRNI